MSGFLFLLAVSAAYATWKYWCSRLGGWQRWVMRFGIRTPPPDGVTYLWCDGHLGGVFGPVFRGVLHVTLTPVGIHIRPSITYRLFHAPLLLPWKCVRGAWEYSAFVGGRVIVLCQSDAPALRLILPGRA